MINLNRLLENKLAFNNTGPNYVYKLIEKGYLPAIKLGSIKILKTTLEQFLVENQGKDFTNLDLITRLDLMEENL